MSKSFLDNADQESFQVLTVNELKNYESPTKYDLPCSERRFPVKILPTYIFNLSTPRHNSFITSKKSTPKRENSARPSSRISNSERKPKKAAKSQKSSKVLKKSESSVKKTKNPIKMTDLPNFQFELDKLIRAVFRHCVVCKGFKAELNRVNADSLLKFYAKNRLEDNQFM